MLPIPWAVAEGWDQAVVDKVTGPLVPRRAIADNLRRLRDESHESLSDVASELLISTSKLSRLENAQGKPNPRDIRDLIHHYNIQGTTLASSMTRWTKDAQVTGWWTDFDDEVLELLDAHLAYETDAAVARTYTLPFVPLCFSSGSTLQRSSAIWKAARKSRSSSSWRFGDCASRRWSTARGWSRWN